MKVWCCSCFGEEDEEEYNKKREMMREREDILGKNGMDDVKFEGVKNADLGFQDPEDDGGENIQLRLGSSREGSSTATTLDVNFNLGPGEEPSSSSAVADPKRDGPDSGTQCKRPKVRSFALEWDIPFVSVPAQEGNLFGLIEEEYERMLNSVGHYLPQVFDGEESDHTVDSTSWVANGDDHLSPDMDDLENKMDLTDDLLHMVFSFLDHINLCKAAKVCRQWRTASTHEDFWRFLNFEDRNISPQQCKLCTIMIVAQFERGTVSDYKNKEIKSSVEFDSTERSGGEVAYSKAIIHRKQRRMKMIEKNFFSRI
ncbi:F-box domain, cyclin-like protein [Cynara cardunculus var. scolymus]|uniref:F-box domain, cyclin-like protein n=1 Tax=Cynara cardunculus var. scolymus TaxID=59895 RepID=A0A103Y2T5_CYNCS|nr:F-box domain, cyclin-like protein [Cynara cardunculus var. scolymus]